MSLVRLVGNHLLLAASNGHTINSDLYWQQLDRLKEVVAQKRSAVTNMRGTVFYHNANTHTALTIIKIVNYLTVIIK